MAKPVIAASADALEDDFAGGSDLDSAPAASPTALDYLSDLEEPASDSAAPPDTPTVPALTVKEAADAKKKRKRPKDNDRIVCCLCFSTSHWCT